MQFFNDCYFSEFNRESCIKVLYTKKEKFATKIAYVQCKVLAQPKTLYTGMPVMPVTNSRSALQLITLQYATPYYTAIRYTPLQSKLCN